MYLDNAATSFPKPDCVCDAVDEFMRHSGVAFGRGSHAAAGMVSQTVGQCRHRLATILDAESDDRVALTFNCTDGLNLLLRGVLSAGDRVVTTTLEHNSVLRPLEQLRRESGIDVVSVGFDTETGMVSVEQLTAALNQAPTRLVVLNHASNVTGVIQPVRKIAAAAHAAGALFLLDAAQTVGHIPFSVRLLDVDLLASAGHKGLLGPLGTGIIYVRRGLEQEIRSVRSGGTGTDSDSVEQPAQMPFKFESGNLNMPGIAGLNAAAAWILKKGPEAIGERTRQLTSDLRERLAEIANVVTYCPDQEANVGVVSFSVGDMNCQEVATILDQSFDIQCRAGLHCAPDVHRCLGTFLSGGTVRFSPGVFTTPSDIDAAVTAVQAIAASV